LIHPVESVPCNSFPKIFGGSSSGTNLLHIDVFNDYLALCGGTCDNTLTGTYGCYPYLALSSISTGGKYYWAKAWTSKGGSYIYGV